MEQTQITAFSKSAENPYRADLLLTLFSST
jgi:hypothetical protein